MGMQAQQLTIGSVPCSAAAQPQLEVRAWIHGLLCSICALSMLLMLWALFSHLQQLGWNKLPAIVSWASMFGASGWLLAQVYSLGSIELDSAGLAQSFAWHRGAIGRRRRLRWEQVQRIARSGDSYYFVGIDGTVLQLNALLFEGAEDRLQAIGRLMPQRLQWQLQGASERAGASPRDA